ncbi:GGDEF domain-containing protein [Neptunicella sp.]|uniref:GGDEF domain-containing protein n=1 Tax=Neptunicella sp. TaxID=2125986 RepID=UPI003F69435B
MWKSSIKGIITCLFFISFVASAEKTVDELLDLADEYRTSLPEESAQILTQVSGQKLNTRQKDQYSYLVAFSFLMKGELQIGLRKLEVLANTTRYNEIKMRAQSSLLNNYSGMYELDKAFSMLNALEHTLKQQDIGNAAKEDSMLVITSFFNNIEEYSSAKQLSEELIATTSSEITKCKALSRLLYAELYIADSKIVEEEFKTAADLCQSIGETVYKQSITSTLADYYIKNNSPTRAKRLLLQNLAEVKSTGYKTMEAYFLRQLIEASLLENNIEQASGYANQLINNYSETDYSFPYKFAFQALSLLNEENANYKDAFTFYKKYIDIEKKEFDKKMAQKLAIQKAKIDRDNQLKLLNKENNLLMTQAELVAQRSQNTQLLLTGAVLLLGLAIIWLIKSRITHKMLRKIAQTDELTGICNRHYFTSQAEASLRYCQKVHQQVSFIVLDLDHFKQVNDKYGHQTGDWALKQAVLAVQQVCRGNDIIGRLGGEEFAILLPSCGVEKACQLAESCREAIAQIDTQPSGHQFRLTASFGISHNTQAGYDLDKLFAYADKALYSSKDSGRNKIYTYQEGNELPA